MNVIGIEHRPTINVIALREGSHFPRLIGDGQRPVIPNVVCGESWGSAAASSQDSEWDGVAVHNRARGFWRHAHDRLVRYLGGLLPGIHGYRTVVATNHEATRMAAEIADAGFDPPLLIAPTQAALARWLARQSGQAPRDCCVAILTIGDVSAESGCFLVRTGARPTIIQSSPADSLHGTGAGYWARHVIHDIINHMADPPPSEWSMELWQAALELGERARRAPPAVALPWIGPFEEQLVSPVTLTAADFVSWPEVELLTDWMADSIRMAARSLRESSPDILLVSGIGANWPLYGQAFAGLPRPVISNDPASDIAVGATWWPLMMDGSKSVAARGPALPEKTLTSNWLADVENTVLPSIVVDPPGMDRDELSRLLTDELRDSNTDIS